MQLGQKPLLSLMRRMCVLYTTREFVSYYELAGGVTVSRSIVACGLPEAAMSICAN